MMYKLFRKAKTSDWSRKLQLKESVDNVDARIDVVNFGGQDA